MADQGERRSSGIIQQTGREKALKRIAKWDQDKLDKIEAQFAHAFVRLCKREFTISAKRLDEMGEEELKGLDVELAKRMAIPSFLEFTGFYLIAPLILMKSEKGWPTKFLSYRYLWQFRQPLKQHHGEDYFPYDSVKTDIQYEIAREKNFKK